MGEGGSSENLQDRNSSHHFNSLMACPISVTFPPEFSAQCETLLHGSCATFSLQSQIQRAISATHESVYRHQKSISVQQNRKLQKNVGGKTFLNSQNNYFPTCSTTLNLTFSIYCSINKYCTFKCISTQIFKGRKLKNHLGDKQI